MGMRRVALLAALMTLVGLAAYGGGGDSTVAAGDGGEATSTTTTTTTGDAADGGTDSTGPGSTPPGPGTTKPGGGTGTTKPTTPPPTTASAPVAGLAVQIRTGGGFVPVEFNFINIPEFTLYADGRVIVTGPTTLEYPGAALPNLLEGRVNTQAVTAAVKSARAAGVFDNPDLGNPPIADAPSTTFTVVDDGQKATLGAYALGFNDGFGLTPAQQEARRKLQAFRDEMTNLGAAARDPYRAVALSVLVRPYQDQGGTEPAPGQADWPPGPLSSSAPPAGALLRNGQGAMNVGGRFGSPGRWVSGAPTPT